MLYGAGGDDGRATTSFVKKCATDSDVVSMLRTLAAIFATNLSISSVDGA
jgi:hypothetical protein